MQVESGNPTVINTVMTTLRGEGVSDSESIFDRKCSDKRILQGPACTMYDADSLQHNVSPDSNLLTSG